MPDGKTVLDLMRTRRTIRQFRQKPLETDDILECIDTARLAPSAANIQPLEYLYIDDDKLVQNILPFLKWAAYIQPAGNPKPGNEPVAYLVVLNNLGRREKNFEYDVGASVENFILAAWSKGIGSCWLLSINREKIRILLDIPENYHIDCVIALGYPAENPVNEDRDDTVKYYKDDEGTLHVPKRRIETIFHKNHLKD